MAAGDYVLRPIPRKRNPRVRDSTTWEEIQALYDLPEPLPHPKTWDLCKYVVAQSKDVCSEGSWVFFEHDKVPLHAVELLLLLSSL